MKKLNLLKNVLDLFWVLSIFTLFGIVILAFLFFISNDMVPITIKSTVITKVDIYAKVLVFIQLIALILFLASIYYLRKIVLCFQKMEIFTIEVISYLNRIGKFLIWYAILSNGSLLLYQAIVRKKAALEINFGSYDSFLVCLSLGLFFMVLSKVFTISKNLKSENDLTI